MQKSAGFPVWPDGEWETVRLIGQGSYGAVYEIRRLYFGNEERAAMKVISIPQKDSDIKTLYSEGYDREDVTREFTAHMQTLLSEYSLMRRLNGSSNVVNCDDVRCVQHDDGIGWDIFIRMELVSALPDVLGKDTPVEQTVRIGKDLCRALELCAKYGIVHRDVKPANIFLSPNGDYKLGDFGIAKVIEKTGGGTKIGTYDYMAPEVYHDQEYGSQADICSLGLVLYWLLNERRLPFQNLGDAKPTVSERENARQRRLKGEPILPPAHGSEALKRIVLKACAYDPKDRFATADDMLRELERLKDESEEPEEAAPEAEKKNLPPARDPWPAGDEDATVGIFGGGTGSTGEKATAGNPAEETTPEEAEDGTVGIWQKPADAEPPKAPEKEASAPEAPKKEAPAADPGGESKDVPEPVPAPEQPPAGNAEEKQRQEADAAPERSGGERTDDKPVAGTGKKKGLLWGAIAFVVVAVIGLILWKVIPSTQNEDPSSPSASGVALSAESASPAPTAKTTPTPAPTPAPTPTPTEEPMDCEIDANGCLVIRGNGIVMNELYQSRGILPQDICSVRFDGNITEIYSNAFRDCVALTSITIPNGVSSIGDHAFCGCTGLKSIVLPDSVKSIGKGLFSECSDLARVSLSSGISIIPNYAFYNCCSLAGIVIPEGIKSIGDYAFYGCTGLNGIVLPDSVKSIGKSLFSECSNLARVSLSSGISIIPNYAFYNCCSLTDIVIPEGIKSIGDYAFYGCTGLKSIVLPDSVKSIGTRGLK